MQKKHVKWIAIAGGVIAAIGIVVIWRSVSNAAGRKVDHSKPPPGTKAVPVSGTPSIFPLKNGSPKNDLVKQLQGYLGVTADGLFGPKTLAALIAKTGKTQIISQADFNAVIAKLSAAAQTSANSSRADKLVDDWNNNAALRMVATGTVQAIGVNEDAYGALTANGKNIGLTPGFNYNRTDYVLVGSTQQGYLKFRVTSGDRIGLYKVDPSKISLG